MSYVNYIEELMSVVDEFFMESLKGEVISTKDQLDLDLMKESLLASLLKEKPTPEEERFLTDNIELFKKVVRGLLTENDDEFKLAMLEILKKQNDLKMA